MQHGKCAFCESDFDHVSAGDVEHFRPKGRVRQTAGSPPERPGYFWLAYSWDNLFFSCRICNQQFKRELFPLRDPERRARGPDDDIAAEEPLLIDPCRDDPALHLTFHNEAIVGLTERGRMTIEVLGLDRDALEEKRLREFKYLARVREMLDRLPANDSLAAEIRADLARAAEDSAEYAAMARALLAARPLPEPG